MRGIKSKMIYLAVSKVGKSILIEDTDERLVYKMHNYNSVDFDRIKRGKSTKFYTIRLYRKSSEMGSQLDAIRKIPNKDKRALAFSIIIADKIVGMV